MSVYSVTTLSSEDGQQDPKIKKENTQENLHQNSVQSAPGDNGESVV